MSGTGSSAPQRPVVVVAGTTQRAERLEALAQGLERRGVEVCVLSAIERTSVPLLQISFKYGAQARYLICGGPDLQADALEKLGHAVTANGVPPANVWAGPVHWDDAETLLRNTEHRLAALGLDLAVPPKVQPPPVTGRPQPHGPTPSGKVPIIPPSSQRPADDEPLHLPTGPVAQLLGSRGGMAAIGATLVLAGGLTTLKLTADEPEATESAVADASLIEPDEPGAPEESEEPEEPDEPDEPLALEVPDDARPAAVPEPVAPPSVEPATESATESATEVANDTPIAIELDEEPGIIPVAVADNDAELVYEALKRQSIRALDVLLVSPPALKKRGRRMVHRSMRFEDAEAHCASLVVDGVAGWRLPEVGEVGWMSKANVVTQGLYWTSTKADAFGTERVVWNVRRRKMAPANARWRGGRVVCVRFQRPGDGPE